MVIDKAIIDYGGGTPLHVWADDQGMTISFDDYSLTLGPDELRDIAAIAGFLGWEGFEHA